jgi:DNA-binding MarR family transcriptional regulator
MTATQTPPVPFGRQLGEAHRAGRALLNDVLAREGTTYETWIAYNLIASGGPEVRRDELERALATALDISAVAVTQLLGQLARFGLIQLVPEAGDATEAQVALTAAGAADYQRLLGLVNQRSAQAFAGVDPDEVQTTIRVLGTYSQQAQTLLAG